MFYFIQATVTKQEDGYTTTRQIPSFYLNGDLQGITSTEHAKKIARDIINTFKDSRLVVYVDVMELENA